MYTDNLALRGCLQAERIVVAQVLLGGEGQLLNILNGLDVVGADVQLLQLVTVERYIMVDVFHNLVKSFALERASLIAAHAFFIRIPNHNLLFFVMMV